MNRERMIEVLDGPVEPEDVTVVPTTGEVLRGKIDLVFENLPAKPLRQAAVLVPLVNHLDGMTMILTRRHDDLAHHAGQVSFPGGRVEEQDEGLVDTALRETEEEIGLHRSRVEIIGRLDDYVTKSGFQISPFVGMIDPPLDLTACPVEVADIFEVPLAYLLDPTNHVDDEPRPNSVRRHHPAMHYGGFRIWGATAGMIYNLYEVVHRS